MQIVAASTANIHKFTRMQKGRIVSFYLDAEQSPDKELQLTGLSHGLIGVVVS
jgi:hypothetical protein